MKVEKETRRQYWNKEIKRKMLVGNQYVYAG
jgi:hypothetical protein